MPTRLADTRTMTLDDAREAFARLAQATLRIERRAAMAEVRIANVKRDLDTANAEDAAALRQAEAALTEYILAHQDEFKKPRQVTTQYGRFGLRTATALHVEDDAALLAALMELGYPDCFETSTRLVKPAISKRLADGEALPGARLASGELATYSVDKALIKQARESA